MHINKNLLLVLSAAAGLVACQPKTPHNIADDGSFQCISAVVTVAGKPMTSVIQWNTKTGATRLLDSTVLTSKATGSQNILVGWVPLGDLNPAIQEMLAREQQAQQQRANAPVAPVDLTTATDSAPAKPVKAKK